MTNNIDKQSFGQAGAVLLADGESATGDFCAVQVLNDAQIDVTWPELVDGAGATALADVVLPAGTVIYGQITSVYVTDGPVLCYKQAR